MSIKPEAKRGLELLAFDLSNEFGRRVSLSEALELAMDAIYGNEVEILDPQGATNAGQEWTTAYDGNGNVVGQR